MSFTNTVKTEICKLENSNVENLSELSAIIRNIGIIDKGVRISTENSSVANRVFNLLKNIYNITPSVTVRRGYNFKKNYIYIIEFKNNKEKILGDLSIKTNDVYQNIPKKYIIDDEMLVKSYIRGLFLATGSINDPKKSRYHLELSVNNESYAEFVSDLLNSFNLNSKFIKRESKYMIYIKESEKISDFLKLLSANNAVMYYENIRIYRDQKNLTNRLNNCEQANVDKIIETATLQLKYIEILKEEGLIDVIDEKLREVIIYREKYPETSLKELSEIISLETGKMITKSGLYHRMKKIEEIAQKISKKI